MASGRRVAAWLAAGVSYDTSHRINPNAEDASWLGEGDLRYLVTKTALAIAAAANIQRAGAPLSSQPGHQPTFT